MIVCSCHAVSEAALREAAAAGVSDSEIERVTRAGSDCGACRDRVAEIVAEVGVPCRAVPCAGCPRRATG
jgi:bacterioferritin-associated ferredoxin